MKKVKKFLVTVILAAILMQAVPFTVAVWAGGYNYESQANALNKLGLYKGISETEYIPDLGSAVNRETGVVMLLRIFGQEEEALLLSNADANAKLANFKDGGTVSEWAKKQVAYAIDKGFVKGTPNKTFEPSASLNGKAYCSLILRELGHDVDAESYNVAPQKLSEIGGLTSAEAVRLGEKNLIRDDLVGISFGALNAVGIDSQRVVDKLIKMGQIDEDTALSVGLVVSLPVPIPSASTRKDRNDDDDDNIVGTGVTSSLEYEQGSLGEKEVYRLSVGEATYSGNLLFTMSIESYYPMISYSFFVDFGNAQTVANAVYSNLNDAINLGYIDLGCFDIFHENDSVDIYFTAIEEAEDINVDIELKEDTSTPQDEFFEDAVGEKVTPGMPHVRERAELEIETGAVRSGTLQLQINGAALDIPATARETADVIAERIYELLLTAINDNPDFSFFVDSYEISIDSTMIIFNATNPGNVVDLVISLE